MTTPAPSWRGIRFLIPGFDVASPADTDVSGATPASVGGLALTPRGSLDLISERACVRQALLLLLLTRPGERVMRPTYGCELHKLLFWPNDDTTAGLAIHFVRKAIARWEPRVDRVRVDAVRNPDAPGRLDVMLEYRVRSTGNEDRLSVQVALDGGGA